MRPIEILIPLVLALYLAWPFTGRKRAPVVGILPAFGLVALITHTRVEGMRWQMFPLYAFTVILFLTSLPAYLKAQGENEIQPRPQLKRFALTLSLLALSTLLPILLPVPVIPRPNGPYPIGTLTRVLVDETRRESYSGKDEPRKFLVQIWYPAEKQTLKTAQHGEAPVPWLPEAAQVAPAIATYVHLPPFFLDHLALVKSAAYENAKPLAQEAPYPVILFSHGWRGFRQQSLFLMQELASQGYIVVAPEHTYAAQVTVFPDGQIAPNNPQALPPSKGKTNEEYEPIAQALVRQWEGDIAYTLNTLEQWNAADPESHFTGLLDLQKLGFMGHSTGAGAIIQFCARDPRCKTGFALDAFMRPVDPAVLESGTKQPFFYLFSELWPFERNTELFNRYIAHTDPQNRVASILGADHYDFSDIAAISPLAAALGFKGPIASARVQEIITSYVVIFFDEHLKGQPSHQPHFPEVRFER